MRTLTALLLAFALSGCATVLKGKSEKVTVAADTQGAQVYVNGQFMGSAPTELNLPTDSTHSIEFRKEGYESRTVLVNKSVGAGWIIADILFGLIPVVIDASTGSWYGFDHNHVHAALEPTRSVSSKK